MDQVLRLNTLGIAVWTLPLKHVSPQTQKRYKFAISKTRKLTHPSFRNSSLLALVLIQVDHVIWMTIASFSAKLCYEIKLLFLNLLALSLCKSLSRGNTFL